MERAGSRSTAFFRMVAERGDVRALHEPFAKVIDHGETELHGHPVTTTDELIDRLLHLAERTMVVFFKDATDKRHQHVLERPDFLRSGRHTLLIRDPRPATGDVDGVDPAVGGCPVRVGGTRRVFRCAAR